MAMTKKELDKLEHILYLETSLIDPDDVELLMEILRKQFKGGKG